MSNPPSLDLTPESKAFLNERLQFSLTWTSVRLPWIRRLVTGEPRLLLLRGRCLPKALRFARVAEEKIRAAVRAAGLSRLEAAQAVVLETDGSLSVVQKNVAADATALVGLDEPPAKDSEHARSY